ncbi:uncharacterized protein LOC142644409 [Castanea sativa]|uniref:uncharacterized protein LOC142644409 n=1 Tax=Castanea sativa TaxID=21020 RepID=UPI003F652DE6
MAQPIKGDQEWGLVLVSPERIIIEKSLRLGFLATNNEAEFEALLVGMAMVQKMKGRIVELFLDSRLVVGQVKGELEARDVRMQDYLGQVRHLAFPKVAGNRRWLLVGTDYFTKWVEAKPLSNIRDVDAKRFFDSKAFRRYCCDLGIKNRYSTPAYPEGNGQAKAVNKVIVSGLKKRLDNANDRWVEELPHVLWTYWTTPRKSTRETLSMIYGAEIVIPLETGFPTLRTSLFTPDSNDNLLKKGLNLIEEQRENVRVQLAHYQQKLKQGYDLSVKSRSSALADLVLRKVVGAAKNPAWGKLGPNWKGSYHITLIAGIGAYFLEDLDENVVPCL